MNGLRLARTLDEVAALRSVWEQLPVSFVDAEVDCFSALVRSRPEVLRPHVLVVDGLAGPSALVVGRVQTERLHSRFGYKTLYSPSALVLRVAHGGVVGAENADAAREIVAELDHALRCGEADAVVVPAVRLGSPLHQAAAEIPSFLRRQRFLDPSSHRRLVLPGTYADLLAQRDRRSRQNLRRQAALLEKQFGGSLSVDVLRNPGDLPRIFTDLEHIAHRTYQRGLGAGFADTPERRDLVRIALERGWFRAWVMSIEGRPVAFWQGTVRDRTYYSSTTGYDPVYARHGVGTVLLLRLFEDVCNDPDVDVIDFGWGDADYKARWGTEAWLEQDIVFYAPTFRAFRMNAIRTAVLCADRGARGVAQRSGLIAWVKRTWRRKLRPTSQTLDGLARQAS